MPDNNEEFNEINDEADFKQEQEKLKKSYDILKELGSTTFEKNKSVLEKNQMAFFKSPAECNDLKIPPVNVAAYYFATEMLNPCDPEVTVAFETYQAVLQVCERWEGFQDIEKWNDVGWNKDGKDVRVLEELLEGYIEERALGRENLNLATVNISCNIFCKAYKTIMLMNQKYRDQNKVIGDIMHPHHRVGNAALILEHLAQKLKEQSPSKSLQETMKKSFIELQNMFVNEYVLPFMEGKALSFMSETRYTLAEIAYEFSRAELAAWFIVNQIQKNSPLVYEGSESDQDKKRLFDLLKNQCDEYIKNTQEKSIKETAAYYSKTAREEMFQRGFNEISLTDWITKVQDIMLMHNILRAKIQKEPLDAEDECRGMAVSDSVTVGYGLPWWGAPDEQCYLRIAERILQERPIDLEVGIANCSMIGSETIHGKDMIQRELNAIKPHFVIISLGGNDAFRGERIQTIFDNLDKMISSCVPNVKVLVALGIPQTFSASAQYRKEFSDILVRLREKYKAHCIETLWIPEKLLVKENIQADGLHFKPAIQLPLAHLAANSMMPILREIEASVQKKKSETLAVLQQHCFRSSLQKLQAGCIKTDNEALRTVDSNTQLVMSYLYIHPTRKKEIPITHLIGGQNKKANLENAQGISLISQNLTGNNGGYQL